MDQDREGERLVAGRGELVFGIVGAVGTDLQTVEHDLCERLNAYGYRAERIGMSRFLKAFDPSLPDAPEHDRLAAYMTAGTSLRRAGGRGDALALFAANQIAVG